MKNDSSIAAESKFSKEVIYQQLQKIFIDPFFSKSDILRRFLLFIVDQTLLGHESWLKEYTIGVKVLNKPTNFKPQENGIVRIHAGRLRRALHNYYDSSGAFDPIQISVPKGSYVPVFNVMADTECYKKISGYDQKKSRGAAPVVAVIPFQHIKNNPLENFLAEGLGLQLSDALMQQKKFSVIAYYTMHNLCEKLSNITTIAASVGAQYLITGNIQSLENRVRIHIQMINAHTNQQISSWMHEAKLTAENIFELQDEIVQLIISDHISKFAGEKPGKAIMAVA